MARPFRERVWFEDRITNSWAINNSGTTKLATIKVAVGVRVYWIFRKRGDGGGVLGESFEKCVTSAATPSHTVKTLPLMGERVIKATYKALRTVTLCLSYEIEITKLNLVRHTS